MRKLLGRLKVFTERLAGYTSIINFIMILYIYVSQKPFGISSYVWLLILSIFIPVLLFIDWKIIFPSALSITFGEKNKEFMSMKKDIKEIKIMVKSFENDIIPRK